MRVIEVFGPTVQGEGPLAGRVCHFVRLGGCDYRCSWCDSMQAVEPALVRQAPVMSEHQIVNALEALPSARMVVLSGGNPALWKLYDLLRELRSRYEVIAVETQGSVWRDWLAGVDSLVVSPKPPSSGMATPDRMYRFAKFMRRAGPHPGVALKVVVFDDVDLRWAAMVHATYPGAPFYVSCGTELTDTPVSLGERYGWLAERVARDEGLADVSVLPQLHVIAWGHKVGV